MFSESHTGHCLPSFTEWLQYLQWLDSCEYFSYFITKEYDNIQLKCTVAFSRSTKPFRISDQEDEQTIMKRTTDRRQYCSYLLLPMLTDCSEIKEGSSYKLWFLETSFDIGQALPHYKSKSLKNSQYFLLRSATTLVSLHGSVGIIGCQRFYRTLFKLL